MEMTIPVTLIVKAPNQQIEDQTVKCELSWTIHRLKGHLSEVYPSKPARDEQKLIYSGQLLSDSVVLKDVLRNYDELNTHTVHLVCTPSRNYKCETMKPKTEPENEAPSRVASTESASASTSTTGLRQRPVHSTQETMTDFQSMWNSLSQPYNNVATDPTQYAMQVALFQQAYAQYINQYMQMVTNQAPGRQPESSAETNTAPAAPAQEPAEGGDAAPAEPDGDEPQADRDWLDWVYVFTRVLVLFCIVYFYSSPLRFAFVLLLGVGLYLYQVGFFRAHAINNNHEDAVADERRRENNNAPQREGSEGPLHGPEQRPTMFSIMWTFFTTFFASLIPEIPNAV